RSCGGERKVGGPAMMRTAWCLLLARRHCRRRRRLFAVTRAARPVAAIPAIAKAVAAIAEAVATIAEASTAALVALAVAVGLAHHRGRALFVLVDAHRQVAQHVFRQPLLALDLGQRGRRRVELEHGEVGFAVLADAERERLHAPVFRIG